VLFGNNFAAKMSPNYQTHTKQTHFWYLVKPMCLVSLLSDIKLLRSSKFNKIREINTTILEDL